MIVGRCRDVPVPELGICEYEFTQFVVRMSECRVCLTIHPWKELDKASKKRDRERDINRPELLMTMLSCESTVLNRGWTKQECLTFVPYQHLSTIQIRLFVTLDISWLILHPFDFGIADGNSDRDLRKEVRQLQLRGWKRNFMCWLLRVTVCKYGQLVSTINSGIFGIFMVM